MSLSLKNYGHQKILQTTILAGLMSNQVTNQVEKDSIEGFT